MSTLKALFSLIAMLLKLSLSLVAQTLKSFGWSNEDGKHD
jgi:hypothetical protein